MPAAERTDNACRPPRERPVEPIADMGSSEKFGCKNFGFRACRDSLKSARLAMLTGNMKLKVLERENCEP